MELRSVRRKRRSHLTLGLPVHPDPVLAMDRRHAQTVPVNLHENRPVRTSLLRLGYQNLRPNFLFHHFDHFNCE